MIVTRTGCCVESSIRTTSEESNLDCVRVFFSSRRRHTRYWRDWSSDVCSSDLRKDTRSIKEIVQFDEEELTDAKIENKTRQTLRIIDKIEKLYQTALKQAEKLKHTPRSKKRVYLRAQRSLGRTRIEMSQLARSIELNLIEKKRLIDNIRHNVERLPSPEREAGRLERRAAKGETASEARKGLL